MADSILWKPELSDCNSCGCRVAKARRYTKESSHHIFCLPCWQDFLDECEVTNDSWVTGVIKHWGNDIAFVLSSTTGKRPVAN